MINFDGAHKENAVNRATLLIGMAALLMLGGCLKDGAPNVDDPQNIVVKGKKMDDREYLKEFCTNKKYEATDENCLKVKRAYHDRFMKRRKPINF